MEVVTSVKLFRFSKWSIGLALWCVLLNVHACEPELEQPLYDPTMNWFLPSEEDREIIRVGFEKMVACDQLDEIALENHYFFFVISIAHKMGSFSSEDERRTAEYERLFYSAIAGYSESVRALASNYKYGEGRYQIEKNEDLFDCLMATLDRYRPPYVLDDSNKAALGWCFADQE